MTDVLPEHSAQASILIVDDDKSTLVMLKMMLSGPECDIAGAPDAVVGLRLCGR